MKAIFWDWHGVLCTENFWQSMPHYHQLALDIFTGDLVDQWMCGGINSRDVLAASLTEGAIDTALQDLIFSCQTMKIDPRLLNMLGCGDNGIVSIHNEIS